MPHMPHMPHCPPAGKDELGKPITGYLHVTISTLNFVFNLILTIVCDVSFVGSDGKNRVNWNRLPLITGSTVDAWQQQHPVFMSYNSKETEEEY
jgi:hypothetical protein